MQGTVVESSTGDRWASSGNSTRRFLSTPQLVVLRFLVSNYVITFVILGFANIGTVADWLERVQATVPPLRILFGLMGGLAAITFFLMFGLSLYHFSRGYVLSKPASAWLWVILLLNFLGIILYYALVIEPEHARLSSRGGAT